MKGAPGVRRDCACPRATHLHGTIDAYTRDGCRCVACRTAQRANLRRYRKLIAYGQWGKQYASPHGVVRRLQALSRLGYSNAEMARYLGVDTEWVRRTALGESVERVRIVTHRKVDEMFEALSAIPPTGRWVHNSQRKAAILGWLPPLAWDDDIDDPEAKPSLLALDPERLSYGERLDLAQVLLDMGLTTRAVHRRALIAEKTVQKVARKAAA